MAEYPDGQPYRSHTDNAQDLIIPLLEQIAANTAGGGGGGGVSDQGAPNTPSNAWPVKPTDAAGVNQQAITSAGDAKITLVEPGGIVGVFDVGGKLRARALYKPEKTGGLIS